jgi:hypothetical protein
MRKVRAGAAEKEQRVRHGSETARDSKEALLCVREMLRSNAGRAWRGGIEQEGLTMADITKQPYAQWLEESLRVIAEFGPVCLCIAATSPDGETFTGYYNSDATDKAVFAHHIQSDVTMDIIRENIETIKRMLEEAE